MTRGRVFRLAPVILILASCAACAPDVVRYNEAGNERFDAGDYETASGDYRQAQVADPDRAEPYYNAANAYNRLAQVDAALAQTEQALKTADLTLAARAWYNLGNAFFDAEQWPQAVEAYKEALRLQPDDSQAKHNLELALRKLEEQEEQEQQEQEQQEQEQQQEQGQEQEQEQEQEQGEQGGATPTPAGGADASAATPAPGEGATPQAGAQEEGMTGMTEEQALQLLQALLDDSQTLQELMQQQPAAAPPAQDW